eukprot:scaffold73363_cov60-Phaeocystis_antarctica.AAC.8
MSSGSSACSRQSARMRSWSQKTRPSSLRRPASRTGRRTLPSFRAWPLGRSDVHRSGRASMSACSRRAAGAASVRSFSHSAGLASAFTMRSE